MPDNRRRRARLDHGPLPGDARKRRRERQRRDARRARAGHRHLRRRRPARVRAAARARGHRRVHRQPAQALAPGAGRARRELERVRARLHAQAVPGRGARRDRAHREPHQRALEGHRPHDALAPRSRSRTAATGSTARSTGTASRARRINNLRGGRHPPGRLDDLAAARQEPLPAARGQQPLAQPQARRGLDRRAAPGPLQQGARSSRPISTRSSTARAPTASRPRRTRSSTGRRSSSRSRSRRCSPGCRRRRATTTRSSIPPPRRSAAAEVLRAMRELRWISADAYARRSTRRSGSSAGATARRSSSPFVFDQVRQELNARLPAKLAARGGLRVYSTVDQRLQFAARRAIKGVLKTPGRPLGRARRDQRAQRQRAGARHLGLRLGDEPVQPRDRRPPLAGLDVQALRARRRAAPRRRPVAGVLPLRLRLVPRGRSRLPAAGRLVAAATPTAAAAAT